MRLCGDRSTGEKTNCSFDCLRDHRQLTPLFLLGGGGADLVLLAWYSSREGVSGNTSGGSMIRTDFF